jgi:sugar phosphate permease
MHPGRYLTNLFIPRRMKNFLLVDTNTSFSLNSPHQKSVMANNSKSLEKSLEKRDGIFYGWVILSIAFITLVLGYAIRNTFSVFYPTIVEEFGWARGNTALMFSIAVIIYGVVAPMAGSLVDRYGPQVVVPAGAIIVGGGVALCSMATARWHFYLFYGVMGAIGLSLAGWAPLSAIISNWFVRRRGLAFGILSAGFGGSLVFASIAQFFISRFGWQTAYVIIGITSIVVIVPLCGLLMRRSPQDKGLLPDGMPLSSEGIRHPDGPEISTGFGGKWLSTTWTLSRAMRTYHFWVLFSISFCLLGFAETIAITHQVFFFRDAGYTPMLAAGVYSVFGLAFVLGNMCSFLSDRIGRERVFVPSCLLGAVAVCLLFLIKEPSHAWMGFLFAVFFGLGIGTAGPVFFTMVADFFHGRYFGSIQGTVVLGFSFGGAIAPWLAGFLHDKTGTYFATFLILLGSLLLSILLMELIAPRNTRSAS